MDLETAALSNIKAAAPTSKHHARTVATAIRNAIGPARRAIVGHPERSTPQEVAG